MDGYGLFRGEHQRRHLIAAHQRVPAVGSVFSVDRDAHLIQHADVALNRPNRNIQFLRQFSAALVWLALQQHHQGYQSSCSICHALFLDHSTNDLSSILAILTTKIVAIVNNSFLYLWNEDTYALGFT